LFFRISEKSPLVKKKGICMNTKSFNRQGRALPLAAAVAVLAASGAWAQVWTPCTGSYAGYCAWETGCFQLAISPDAEESAATCSQAYNECLDYTGTVYSNPSCTTVKETGGGSGGGWGAQYDTAYVPFTVNAGATVRAAPASGTYAVVTQVQMSVAANTQTTLRIPLPKTTGVTDRAQRQPGAPAIVNNGGGKVTLNLPAQSYKNAEISIYAVNGKRILRKKVSASRAANSVSRKNAVPGVYLLSVTGTDGGDFASRLTHNGGNLDIAVAFDGENRHAARQLAKEAAAGDWNVTVSATAAGYADTVFAVRPVKGTNPAQNITLRALPPNTYPVTVTSAGTGATGGGSYAAGAAVSISAGTAPAGKQFKNWTTASNGVTFANANGAATTFTMPANAVTVTANFEAIPVTPVLSAPANVEVYAESETSIILSWSAVSGAEGYYVYRATGANGTYSRIGDVKSAMPYIDAGLSAGEVYYYKVSAYSGSLESAPVSAHAHTTHTTFIDGRDGKTYKYVTIGNQIWMAENLNFASSGSRCYDCAKYGMLYNWNTAKTVCPAGWHLPTRREWGELAIFAGGTGDYGAGGIMAGTKLKSTTGWHSGGNGTDDYGFQALPGGYFETYNLSFRDDSFYGYWWTATENGSGSAYYRYMYYGSGIVGERYDSKTDGSHVRCVGGD
jgi:uncharacterized protein (TIGR02145 family)